MKHYPEAAMERAMKVQEVILRAIGKRITWWQAAEILGISCRSMQRWKWRYEQHGYDGLLDRRRGKPSPRRVPLQTVEQVLQLYREKYFDLNVRHPAGRDCGRSTASGPPLPTIPTSSTLPPRTRPSFPGLSTHSSMSWSGPRCSDSILSSLIPDPQKTHRRRKESRT